MAKKKKAPYPIAVAQCSLCDEITVTFGEQKHGGIRWCRDCLKRSLLWVQSSEEQRAMLMQRFDEFAALPGMAVLIEAAKNFSPETRKSMAIGESRRRLFESGNADGTEFLP